MNKFHFIYLFLFVVFITRFDLSKCQDEEGSGGEAGAAEGGGGSEEKSGEPAVKSGEPEAKSEEPTEKSGEPEAKSEEPTEKSGEPEAKSEEPAEKSGEPEEKSDQTLQSGGDGDSDIGTNDGKCDCCEGNGIICGLRLKWCGATGCDPTHLYYCDKNNKKAYEYEQCKHICIIDHHQNSPDFCSIKIDSNFFYPRKEKFEALKKDFNNQIENFNKTARENFEKFSHSFDVSPEEREAIKKQQIAAEEEAKAKAKEQEVKKTTTPASDAQEEETKAAEEATEAPTEAAVEE